MPNKNADSVSILFVKYSFPMIIRKAGAPGDEYKQTPESCSCPFLNPATPRASNLKVSAAVFLP